MTITNNFANSIVNLQNAHLMADKATVEMIKNITSRVLTEGYYGSYSVYESDPYEGKYVSYMSDENVCIRNVLTMRGWRISDIKWNIEFEIMSEGKVLARDVICVEDFVQSDEVTEAKVTLARHCLNRSYIAKFTR